MTKQGARLRGKVVNLDRNGKTMKMMRKRQSFKSAIKFAINFTSSA